MSRPSSIDDPQAPLLAGGEEPSPSPSPNLTITIFNRTFSVVQLLSMMLALVAIGVSIAAIGKLRPDLLHVLCLLTLSSVVY
jgi:hypothetical protein